MKILFRSGLVVAALVAPAVASTAASAKSRHITVRRTAQKAPPMMPGYYSYGYGSYNPPFYNYGIILGPLFKTL